MKKNEKILNYATAVLIALTVLLYNFYETQMCYSNNYFPGSVIIDYYEFALCSFLGLMFLGVGVTMLVTVRKYSP